MVTITVKKLTEKLVTPSEIMPVMNAYRFCVDYSHFESIINYTNETTGYYHIVPSKLKNKLFYSYGVKMYNEVIGGSISEKDLIIKLSPVIDAVNDSDKNKFTSEILDCYDTCEKYNDFTVLVEEVMGYNIDEIDEKVEPFETLKNTLFWINDEKIYTVIRDDTIRDDVTTRILFTVVKKRKQREGKLVE